MWRAVVCWREVGEMRFVGGRVVVCVVPVGVRGPLALPLARDVFASGGTPWASTWSEVGDGGRTAGGGVLGRPHARVSGPGDPTHSCTAITRSEFDGL